ncbi:unnamed protein product [Ceratitis capitata]|uniref:(Mediterranean fruit fly) hypothetical protein n=1 Tax=Ceratitis capitata TaxID=7213 RepID=A0A811V473_CERCA|nr:unnamed protein product [Ceratitis capitata]
MRERTMEAAAAINRATTSAIMKRKPRNQPIAKRPNCRNCRCKFGSVNGCEDKSGASENGNTCISLGCSMNKTNGDIALLFPTENDVIDGSSAGRDEIRKEKKCVSD